MSSANTAKQCREERKALAALIRSVGDLEGKFVRKLGVVNLRRLKNALCETNGVASTRHIYDPKGSKVDLSVARQELARCEEDLHQIDKLESCPALDEYRAALDALIAAEARLKQEAGSPLAACDAKRLGLVRAILSF